MDLEKKLQGLQLIAQEKLQAIICSIPGKKDLIIESSLIKPLEHVCSASWLKLKGIQRIYKYDTTAAIARSADQVQIYFIPSDFSIFQTVLKHLHEIENQQPTDLDSAIKNFHLICVPNSFQYFQNLLEEEGLYGIAQIHRFSWDFIYMDRSLLCLEVSKVFANVFLRQDNSILSAIAQSLRILQIVCGRPDFILTYGEHAVDIVNVIERLSDWPKTSATLNSDSEFAAMIVIDRDKDYASPLLTPAIYAGLLLEVFQLRAGEIDLDLGDKISKQKLDIFKPVSTPKQVPTTKSASANKTKNSIRLNSLNDEIYGENRYKHFAQASSLIRAQAKAIGLEVQKLNEMKLEEMHEYVARKLPKITELKSKVLRHLNASEKLIEMLATNYRKVQSLEEDILNNVNRKRLLNEVTEELLTTDGQRLNTLRLMCLIHLCCGVTSDELQPFVRNYCNYFGSQQLNGFELLANAGLLPELQEEEVRFNKSATKLLSNIPLPKFQQTQFQANANRLKLLATSDAAAESNDEAKNANKSSTKNTCPSYVFNGLYIPLIAQLCSILLNANSNEDLVSKLGIIDKLYIHTAPSFSAKLVKNLASKANNVGEKELIPLRKRSIFVYVVGGITYAEIGACDLISKLTNSNIVVASDSIISGADLLADVF